MKPFICVITQMDAAALLDRGAVYEMDEARTLILELLNEWFRFS